MSSTPTDLALVIPDEALVPGLSWGRFHIDPDQPGELTIHDTEAR